MRCWILVLFLCAGACGADETAGDWRTVRTAQGPVRGRLDPSGDFYAFYNIPYATAPKGKDKFKAPLPAPVWLQPLDAVDGNIICPQTTLSFLKMDSKKMQEDCLIANVFIPNTEKKDLPVLVYVHGGAFQIGFGTMVETTNLLKTKKAIIVNFNYRLGIHGFLCLGTKDAPGNAGMKDQVALLRWVNKNIASFSGNPKDVTIIGYSAGSASVDLLMLSKAAEGLFNKVIPESGANLAAFAVQLDPIENAKNHAKKLNFTDIDDIYALEEFYKTASFEVLTLDPFFDNTDSTFVFSPCVERNLGDEVFLDKSPLNILKEGKYKKVPMLYGFASMEGLLRIDFFEVWRHRMNEKFSDFLPADLTFENDSQREQVAQQIKKFYFGNKPVQEDTVLGYVDFFSDVIFTYPTLWAVKLHADAGHDQVFLYEYSYAEESSSKIPHTDIHGANHCAQTSAVVDGVNIFNRDESIISDEYKKLKKIIREIWLNFVTTGKPVPEGSALPAWPPAGADRSPHMLLDKVVQLRGPLLENRTRFWDDIYARYYRHPVPPPVHPPKPHIEL